MAKNSDKIIAVTGATGFLGGHVLSALTSAGFPVRALTRRPQSSSGSIEWISGSLENEDSLHRLCMGANCLVNIAGLTKAVRRDDFFDVNAVGTERVFNAAEKQGLNHVIHISSLAAREPQLSHYGASKAATEDLLTQRSWSFDWSIIRPPAIYGPGDTEILKLLKASRYGILPAPGGTKNRFSMIHAADLAAAIACRVQSPTTRSIEEIDDNTINAYQISDVIAALPNAAAKPVRAVPMPFPILATLGAGGDLIARVTGKPSMLTISTARYLCHPDWRVDESKRFQCKSWAPQFDLKSGLEDTMQWYRKNQLL